MFLTYVVNKLCYSYRECSSRYLNDFGVYVKGLQFDTVVKRKVEQLTVDTSYLGLCRYYFRTFHDYSSYNRSDLIMSIPRFTMTVFSHYLLVCI